METHHEITNRNLQELKEEKRSRKKREKGKKGEPNHERVPKHREFLPLITTRRADESLGRFLIMVPKSSCFRSSCFPERVLPHKTVLLLNNTF
jgi:hypothetical protein